MVVITILQSYVKKLRIIVFICIALTLVTTIIIMRILSKGKQGLGTIAQHPQPTRPQPGLCEVWTRRLVGLGSVPFKMRMRWLERCSMVAASQLWPGMLEHGAPGWRWPPLSVVNTMAGQSWPVVRC